MEQSLQKWFPTGKKCSFPSQEEGHIALPLATGGWFEVAETDMTEREQALLNLFLDKETPKIRHPWHTYLSQAVGQVPQTLSQVQFLHARIWGQGMSTSEWLEMMQALLPNLVSQFYLDGQTITFVLDASQSLDVKELLEDTIRALEFDFGLRLTLFLGQIWQEKVVASWPRLFQAESQLFQAWQARYSQSTVLSFSQLVLWAQRQGIGQTAVLYPILQEMIVEQNMTDVILALWEEGAVVTKAAQRLYLHRNTLQYRLEKWHELTGLQLKNLTDLSLCYSLILDELF